jgi:hypothetical protein
MNKYLPQIIYGGFSGLLTSFAVLVCLTSAFTEAGPTYSTFILLGVLGLQMIIMGGSQAMTDYVRSEQFRNHSWKSDADSDLDLDHNSIKPNMTDSAIKILIQSLSLLIFGLIPLIGIYLHLPFHIFLGLGFGLLGIIKALILGHPLMESGFRFLEIGGLISAIIYFLETRMISFKLPITSVGDTDSITEHLSPTGQSQMETPNPLPEMETESWPNWLR